MLQETALQDTHSGRGVVGCDGGPRETDSEEAWYRTVTRLAGGEEDLGARKQILPERQLAGP